MGKHGQIVMGPAGSGKSTYCAEIMKHCEQNGRTVHVVNLDPAAEHFKYPMGEAEQGFIDIRELITLEDAMGEMGLGPNGGLIFCMEQLLDNLSWLGEKLGDYGDDYLIFDLPGQIELYTHLPLIPRLVQFLTRQCGYNLCAVYLLDSVFITDGSRFASGALMCLAAMIQMELPHVNILSKCDLLPSKKQLKKFLDPDMDALLDELAGQDAGSLSVSGAGGAGGALVAASGAAASNSSTAALRGKRLGLSRALASLVTQYSLVNFFPLDLTEEECISLCLQHIDRATGYGEDLEPKEPKDGHEQEQGSNPLEPIHE